MDRFPRRSFLGSMALALCPAVRSARAIDPIARSRPSHLKLSLAAYSLRDRLSGSKRDLDLFQFAELAADWGADAIEPTSYYFPPDADAAFCHRLQAHAFRLGLDVSGTAVANDFCRPPGPKRDADLAHVRKWVDLAAAMHAPVIRIFAGSVPSGSSEDEAVARAVQGINDSLAYAAERGIALALENHGGVTETAEGLLRIVRAVSAPANNFGVNLDTGNFHSEDPYAELASAAPFALNVQVKTEVSPGGTGHVEADLRRVVGILRDARYSGYVVLEYEAAADPMTAIPQALRRLRELIS